MSNALRGLLNVDEIQAGELATGCLCVGEVKKKKKKAHQKLITLNLRWDGEQLELATGLPA